MELWGRPRTTSNRYGVESVALFISRTTDTNGHIYFGLERFSIIIIIIIIASIIHAWNRVIQQQPADAQNSSFELDSSKTFVLRHKLPETKLR